MYEMAEILTDREKPEKVAFITFKMAESLHQLADSGTENNESSQKILDDAEVWLNISDGYRDAAKESKEVSELAGQKNFNEALHLYDLAKDSNEDIRTVRLPLLDEAEKRLNESDAHRIKARAVDSNEYYPTPVKKRGIRLGTRAVMRTVKSSIKSTLNRHN